MDVDYIEDLSEEEQAWLNRFMGEYYSADLYTDPKNNLHNTEELKKDCTDRNNARNRCQYSVAKARNKIIDVDEKESPYGRHTGSDKVRSSFDLEDSLIKVIDDKIKEEKSE